MAPDAMREAARSLSDARPVSYWLDDPGKPVARPALTGDERCDLLVVGGATAIGPHRNGQGRILGWTGERRMPFMPEVPIFAEYAPDCVAQTYFALAVPALAQTTLNVGMSAADVSQLDPHRATTTQDKPLTSWLYNGLVRFSPGSASLEKLEPDLAERWESSADKLTWTFYLRKNVKFHGDYGQMTAEDVVFSLKRAADSKTSSFSADYASIDTVEAVESPEGRALRCTECGHRLGDYGDDHKQGTLVRELPITATSELNALGRVDEMVLREFCCPGCGTSVAMDVQLAEEPVLEESRFGAT